LRQAAFSAGEGQYNQEQFTIVFYQIEANMDTEHMYFERQKAYLESELQSEMQPGRGVVEAFTQIPRLVLGRGPLNEDLLRAALDLIHARRDCADFALSGLLRILYRFGDSPLLSAAVRAEIEEAVLGFCYWYDQPGVSGMCFHTENHQILFHSCEVLAGELFSDRTFRNAQRARYSPGQSVVRPACSLWLF
jgi:hypothetical protein